MTAPLLEVEGLSLSIHGTPILKGLDLALEAGCTLGVIGESGSGKSLTALSIMRLLPRGSNLNGDIHLAGRPLLSRSEPARSLSEREMCELRGGELGMIFQEPMTALNPLKSIGEQVAESVMIHTGKSRRAAWQQAAEVLEHVELPNDEFPLTRYPHELSGGQRQRVVIAIAVACNPQLLIADEPTTALDVTTQVAILDLLRRLQRESGMALMLITHDLALVADMADDIIIMRHGEIPERGSREEIFRHPRHDYTKMLFRASAMVEGAAPPREHDSRESLSGRNHDLGHTAAVKDGSREPFSRRFRDADHTENSAAERIIAESAATESAATESAATESAATESAATESAATESAGEKAPRPLLTVRDLSVDYPLGKRGLFQPRRWFRAVDSVSFDILLGENLGLVGESGCGKSTLTRALLGLTPISEGEVVLLGQSIAHAGRVSRASRREMQVVFQDPYGSFNPRHKVARLVAEPLHLLDAAVATDEKHRMVVEVLEQVGLSASDGNRYIHEFSGGQRQRIAIARALMLHPKLIILDEAVSALDVSVRAQVLGLLRHLGDDKGIAYLFISHDLSVVERVTDRVLVMKDGRIVERGNTHDVFTAPRKPYTQELVAAVPRLPAWVAAGDVGRGAG
ncbi:MAG: ABC transporter ATP-binding protein [Gammaproteobacteria bacterium]|nr:MAG: ABC transporter ATP-binding protein [Gammaproteobacteria bacterium]